MTPTSRSLFDDLGLEAECLLADAPLDHLVQADERAAVDEQDVGRIDLEEFLVRMLAPALGRHVGRRAFEDLKQRLLHALTRDVARDRRVLVLAADLVDLVDVDDALLALLDVAAGGLQQLEDDVLDVLADVTASVSVVASTIVNGTDSSLASVCASSVLPVPVGPISRMLDLVSSTSCRLRGCFWISSRL